MLAFSLGTIFSSSSLMGERERENGGQYNSFDWQSIFDRGVVHSLSLSLSLSPRRKIECQVYERVKRDKSDKVLMKP